MRKGTPKSYNGIPDMRFHEEPPDPPKVQSRKDTRKWCAGHPGRLHIPMWENLYNSTWKCRTRPGKIVSICQHQVCFRCGKHLGNWKHKYFYVTGDKWTQLDWDRWTLNRW